MPSGGYLWWYLDALSDCGRYGLSIIAFVGSVFSPYYAWAQRRGAQPDANDYCCLNVSLYGPARRWTMTERGARWCGRDATRFELGPSALQWHGDHLSIDINERAVPLPWPVRGQVRVYPKQLFTLSTVFNNPIDLQWLAIKLIKFDEVVWCGVKTSHYATS